MGAIDKRHDIYYDAENGTIAAVKYYRNLSDKSGVPAILELDGKNSVEEVTKELIEKLGNVSSTRRKPARRTAGGSEPYEKSFRCL